MVWPPHDTRQIHNRHSHDNDTRHSQNDASSIPLVIYVIASNLCPWSCDTSVWSGLHMTHDNTQKKWMSTKGFLWMGSICLEVQLLAVIIQIRRPTSDATVTQELHQCATIWYVLEIRHAWDPRTLSPGCSDTQSTFTWQWHTTFTNWFVLDFSSHSLYRVQSLPRKLWHICMVWPPPHAR